MKRIEEFTQEEKLSILGGSTGGATLDEGDCLGVFGGGCKEGWKSHTNLTHPVKVF